MFFSLFSYSAFCQIGGVSSYEFLRIPVNARIAGIGGVNVSTSDKDVNLFMQNPASLNDSMLRFGSVNYVPYFADIHGSAVTYAFQHKKLGTFGVGLHYFNYGRFQETDATGNEMGQFNPNEYALMISKSHTVDNFSVGATLKLAGSHIHTYSSFAGMLDIGGMFRHPEKDFNIGLVIKNAGLAFKRYNPETPVSMPFDVQLGTSFKPEHMPLRFSVTAHHLHKFDIVYNDPSQKKQVDLDGNEIENKVSIADKIGRHFILGGEFLLGKNLNILFGYNYLRRRELRMETRSGGAGFSLGAMVRVKSFEFAYTRAFYHVAGGASYLTLTSNFNTLLKKRQ